MDEGGEHDDIERALRDVFARHPRPAPPPGFAGAVLAHIAAGGPPAPRRPGVVLALCWLGVAGASVAVLAGLPWPAWAGPALLGGAFACVPAGFAAFLWPRAAVAWMAWCVGPLVARGSRG